MGWPFSMPMSATPVYVSLDLETTGLNPESEEIIEIAAVKFEGQQVIDTFHSLVNPARPLPYRIQVLCGISQPDVDGAPGLSAVAPELVSFLGPHRIVGHNIAFDIGFLSEKGIKLSNPVYDTYELASLLLPQLSDYSLSHVAQHLGHPYSPQHRALPDATAAKDVFLALLEKASQLDITTIAEIVRLTTGTGLSFGRLFGDIEKSKAKTAFASGSQLREVFEEAPKALRREEPLTPNFEKEHLNIEELSGILESGGPLAQAVPGYEHRPEQIEMMQAVARALNESEHLIVEAGTGTGKSIAYLLPSVFFSLQNNVHVVISTNTINLQEQLLAKDIPELLQALRVNLRAVQLKGRSNYLCLRRLSLLRRSEGLSPDEVKLLSRILVWLPLTRDGDRAELNLSWGQAAAWDRVCAQVDNCLGGNCPYLRRGACFLYRARQAAEGARLIVVNHALLLSDIVAGSSILPEYSHLVIDEAHHLEEEATEQFGFQVTQRRLFDYLNRLSEEVGGQRYVGLLQQIKNCFGGSGVSPSIQREIGGLAEAIRGRVDRARIRVSEFFNVFEDFVELHSEDQDGYERRLRITRGIRAQPGWSRVEIVWENLGLVLKDIDGELGRLYSGLEGLSDTRISDYENMMLELTASMRLSMELHRQINSLVANPEGDFIYWTSLGRRNGMVTLFGVPQHVGRLLEKFLFSKKDCVILTSATLSTEGTFEYIKERLGLEYVNELLLGAPFDYQRSTMIYIPRDIPEPGTEGYQQAVERVLIELCRATQGRTMALFTSHAALRATYAAIQAPLEEEPILVLGQGVDGSPKQLLATFKTNLKTVLLGTASFWEGVDVIGQALSVLVMVRLPFSVPTDPVFAARSEMFDDPFNQYALPQAALKFKQGFGRLIRSKSDRGVMVILDRRVQSKYYGTAFLKSLPPSTVISGSSRELPHAVASWLGIGGERFVGLKAPEPDSP